MASKAYADAAAVRVGVRPPSALFERGADELRRVVSRVEELGIDQVCVGDHVSFNGGQGFDGLVQATALAVLASRAVVQTAVYLLPLRHPVPVARQVASVASLASGRFVFGVGVGGEDRHEVEICGVDPATRGRRMNESLAIIRSLLAGETVSFDGEFFQLRDAAILPAPSTPVPILVGGRSEAALRRAARHGDGWWGVWVSPERFAAATAEVESVAAAAGRTGVSWQHGIQVWCGFGSDPEDATPGLAAAMEQLYRVPFANFDRYSPRGTAEDVAEALSPYLDAGCRSINLIPAAASIDEAIEAVAAVRRLLLEVPRLSGPSLTQGSTR
jgi:alkanesulfonate monooxygenase SsuD/methylene tetrahydromethanopterin reductase-like flavin-dependent oxidoreductase (luciferase family)